MLSAAALHGALNATWPPASHHACGPFTLREGKGGGKRVNAATLDGGDAIEAEITAAEAAMQAQGQNPLFMIRAQRAPDRGPDQALDQALAARGYIIADPTLFYTAPIAEVAQTPLPISLLSCWPPLAIQRQLWADAGIGRARLAVMARATAPRNAFIAQFQNRAAGVGFAALHNGIAMLHAMEVVPDFRRQGVARYMARGIADWARGQGAEWFALAVTERNMAARALYTALNMQEAGKYHYRQHPKAQP